MIEEILTIFYCMLIIEGSKGHVLIKGILFLLYCIWVGFWAIINIALEILRDLLTAAGA